MALIATMPNFDPNYWFCILKAETGMVATIHSPMSR